MSSKFCWHLLHVENIQKHAFTCRRWLFLQSVSSESIWKIQNNWRVFKGHFAALADSQLGIFTCAMCGKEAEMCIYWLLSSVLVQKNIFRTMKCKLTDNPSVADVPYNLSIISQTQNKSTIRNTLLRKNTTLAWNQTQALDHLWV